MYCNTFEKEKVVPPTKFHENAQLRLVPSLLSQENRHFTLKDCTFTMEQYKIGSARQVFFTEFKILNSFTLENSFFKKCTEKDNEITSNRINNTSASTEASQSKTRSSSSSPGHLWDSKRHVYHFSAADHR